MSSLLLVCVTAALLIASHFRWLDTQRLSLITLGHVAPVASSPRPVLGHMHLAVGKRSIEARQGAPTYRSGRDPLDSHRAIVGPDARTPWYVRVRAAVILVVLVVATGAALAGFTLLLIASGRILLETLAG